MDRRRNVDDRPYGGGSGMVMLLDPVVRALESLFLPGRILVFTPRGRPFTQTEAARLAMEPAITMICGRYEGIDERLMELFPIEPMSVGDFVLNGGEAAACCVLEAVARLLPGYMGHEATVEEESFVGGLLEYPHYTRPGHYRGLAVPAVLQSGNHAAVASWRREASLAVTLRKRPELLAGASLFPADFEVLRKLAADQELKRLGQNLYVFLVYSQVLNRYGEIRQESLTNINLQDIICCFYTYGLGGYWLVMPFDEQRRLTMRFLDHWAANGNSTKTRNFLDCTAVLSKIHLAVNLETALTALERIAEKQPLIVATRSRISRKDWRGSLLTPAGLRQELKRRPVALLLSTCGSLTRDMLVSANELLTPIRDFGVYNYLSVHNTAIILVDRILGDIF